MIITMGRRDDHIVMRIGAPPHDGTTRGRCFLSPTSYLHCERCDESIPMPLGAIPWVAGVLKLFASSHRDCKPKATAEVPQ